MRVPMEIATVQVTTIAGRNTTNSSTGMNGDAIANFAAAEAHMAGLMAADQLATAQGRAAISLNGLSWTATAHVPAAIAKELVTAAVERLAATATDERSSAVIAEELGTTTKMRVDSAREQVTTADESVTATTFSNVLPDPEDEVQSMSAAPITGTTSAVSNDHVSYGSSGSLGCQSTTTADCMDATHLQPPLPERKDHVEGQEGHTIGASIVNLNAAKEAGELVQFDEEVSMHRMALHQEHEAAGRGQDADRDIRRVQDHRI